MVRTLMSYLIPSINDLIMSLLYPVRLGQFAYDIKNISREKNRINNPTAKNFINQKKDSR